MGKMIERAALYLRSSKDRADASIDVQRRQLREMASERGFALVAEFSDVVESGKDENRPGFQALLTAVRSKHRGWETLLLLDTSRLSRRRTISIIFEEVEARKHGVRVVYKSLPESDPITEMLMKSIFQAMDEWHSMNSKAKGLAGMAENVRQGWRAGGRAPIGYRLVHSETGALREGMPVLKSKLAVTDDAPAMTRFLKLRAAGRKRADARAEAGLTLSSSTLVGIEWNALTYAGHTVWNVRNEQAGAYKGGVKRKPRCEWVMQRETHKALIADDEAEAILRRLEAFDRGRHSHADYLLTGILKTPDGRSWHGDDGFYRIGKGKKIKAAAVEQAVLAQVADDLESDTFIAAMNAALKKRFDARRRDDALPALRKEAADLDRRMVRLTEMLPDTSQPEPLLRQVEAHEKRRRVIEIEIVDREQAARDASNVSSLTNAQVRKFMRSLRADMVELDRDRLREFLAGLLDRVTLDPVDATCQMTYRMTQSTGVRLASPGGFEPPYLP